MRKGLVTSFLVLMLVSTVAAGQQQLSRQDLTGTAIVLTTSVAGFPPVTYRLDTNSKIVGVDIGDRELVAYRWIGDRVVSATVADSYTFEMTPSTTGRIRQILRDHTGIIRYDNNLDAAVAAIQTAPVALYVVAAQLGLGAAWQPDVTFSRKPGRACVISGRDGQLLASVDPIDTHIRVVRGADRAPLFLEIDVSDYVPAGTRLKELPNVFLVTPDLRVQANTFSSVPGGVASIWSEDPITEMRPRWTVKRIASPPGQGRVRPAMMVLYQCGWYVDQCTYWWDGTVTCIYYPAWCYYDTGGYSPPDSGDGGGGGGGTTTTVDPEVQTLIDQYTNHRCTVPSASDFTDSAHYVNPGHFTFDELRDPNYQHAIIKDSLRNGLEATRTNYGSAITVTSGYRSPDTNAGTAGSASCSDHCYGTAADLSIRNSSGAHDCSIWDALAQAGHDAGAWVEPWSSLVNSGTPNHVHLDFGRPANTPSDYGQCDPSQVTP